MKRIIGGILFTLLLMGCWNPVGPEISEIKTGSLSISLSSGRTIVPDLDQNVSYCIFTGTGPDSASFGPVTVSGTAHSIDDLVLGDWTISAQVFNSSDFLLAEGSNTINVVSGTGNSVTIEAYPTSDTGGIDLTLTWPSASLSSPDITAYLTPPGGTEAQVTFTAGTGTANYTDTEAAPGYHLLRVTLAKGAFSHTFLEYVRVFPGYTTTGELEITEAMVIEDAVPEPVVSLSTGTYTGAQTINLSCLDPSASIYYTLNGALPTSESGILYTGSITLNTSAVLKTAAINPYGIQSTLGTHEYEISGTVARPQVNVGGGLHFEPVTIELSCTTANTTIIYTTNGTTPVPGGIGTTYSGAFEISADAQLRVLAYDNSNLSNQSDLMSSDYQITGYAEDPVFSLAEGSWSTDQTLSLSCGTAGVAVYYTTDGTTPSASHGTAYSNPITIDRSMTVKAIAVKADWGDSAVISKTYEMVCTAPIPTVSEGTYNSIQDLVFSTVTPDTEIRYTTDNTAPTTNSTLNQASDKVSVSRHVRAVAFRDGWTQSAETVLDYELKCPVPTLSVPAGDVLESLLVLDFSSSIAGVYFVSTTDGTTTPTDQGVGNAGSQVVLSTDSTVEVIAAKTGWTSSDVVSATYDLSEAVVSTPDEFDVEPVLSWNGFYTTYTIQIAEDSGFTTIVAESTAVIGSEFTLTGIGLDKTYFWRVKPQLSADTWGVWYGPWSFTTSSSPSVSGFSPADGGSTTSTQPVLDWDDVASVSGYTLTYDTVPSMDSNPQSVSVNESTYTMVNPLENQQNIYWTVTPIAKNSVSGNASAVQHFTVIIPGSIVVNPQETEPLEITFTGAVSSLSEGETMTVSAGFNSSPDSMQWYLNGNSISDATTAAVTVGSGLSRGTYTLSLVARSDDNLYSESVDFIYIANDYTPIYQVSYSAGYNGMSRVDSSTYAAGDTVTVQAIGSFARNGYTFNGWDSNGDSTVDYAAGAEFSMGSSDISLTAIWSINSYTLTFDGNGGTAGTHTEQVLVYNTPTALSENTYIRTGYTFAGWDANGDSSVDYADGASFTIGSSNVTLTAIWTVNSYTVTFAGNEADDGTMSTQSFNYNETTNLTANAFTKTGYTFAGWDSNGDSIADYADGANYTMGSENVTLTAVWTINSYNITFLGNNHTAGMMNVQHLDYDTSAVLYGNNYSRTGYTFAGWDANGDSSVDYSNGASFTMGCENVTLTAVWRINSYAVTYYGNGATSGTMSVQYLDYNETVANLTANNFARTGYAFLGWDADGDSELDYLDEASFTMGSSSVSLQAIWVKTYTEMAMIIPPGSSVSFKIDYRSVTLTKPFLMSTHEITQEEYLEVTGGRTEGWTASYGLGDNYPAYYISFYEAVVFCNLLSMQENRTPCYTILDSTDPDDWSEFTYLPNEDFDAVICDFTANGYRLPTEAEWGYAASEGESYTYASSETIGDIAWYCENSKDLGEGDADYGSHPVGEKQANCFGLYDMTGNVWELCWDWYYSPFSGGTDPEGPETGSSRLIMGGSWEENASFCETEARKTCTPYFSLPDAGIRLVLPL